jgi:hypothetical protein
LVGRADGRKIDGINRVWMPLSGHPLPHHESFHPSTCSFLAPAAIG